VDRRPASQAIDSQPCATVVPIVARHTLFVVTVPGVCTSPPMLSVLGFVQPVDQNTLLTGGRPCCRQDAVRLSCQKSTHISVPPRPYTWSSSPATPTTAPANGRSVHLSIVLRRVLRQVSVSSAHASQVALRRSCASFVAEHPSCSCTISPGSNQSHHHPR
jgi:hypothetical protein